jgi:hypothetical protein
VQWSPPLVVAAVDVGAVLHQELHHLEVVVDAGLESGRCKVIAGFKSDVLKKVSVEIYRQNFTAALWAQIRCYRYVYQ